MMSVNRRQKILWWMLKVFALSVPLSSFLSMRINYKLIHNDIANHIAVTKWRAYYAAK